MVLEYGDIDLARLLQNHEEARRRQHSSGGGGAAASGGGGSSSSGNASGSGEIDENFIRLYWQQMLQVRQCKGCIGMLQRAGSHPCRLLSSPPGAFLDGPPL